MRMKQWQGVTLLFSLVLIVVSLIASCSIPSEFRAHSEFIQREVLGSSAIHQASIMTDGLPLSYRFAGQANDALVVWIHGTPGSWSDIGKLLVNQRFLQSVKIVSIDRPGWGESRITTAEDTLSKKVYPDFDQQSKYISPLLIKLKQQHPNVPLIIAGHSWGGSLAPTIAADNPQIVDGLLILSGGLSAELTKPRWYNKVAKLWPVSAIIGKDLRQSNIEMYSLSLNLESLTERWQSITGLPVIVVQGGKDSLVNPKNADYIEQLMQKDQTGFYQVVRKPDYGHLLQIKHTDMIAQCIYILAALDYKLSANSSCANTI